MKAFQKCKNILPYNNTWHLKIHSYTAELTLLTFNSMFFSFTARARKSSWRCLVFLKQPTNQDISFHDIKSNNSLPLVLLHWLARNAKHIINTSIYYVCMYVYQQVWRYVHTYLCMYAYLWSLIYTTFWKPLKVPEILLSRRSKQKQLNISFTVSWAISSRTVHILSRIAEGWSCHIFLWFGGNNNSRHKSWKAAT